MTKRCDLSCSADALGAGDGGFVAEGAAPAAVRGGIAALSAGAEEGTDRGRNRGFRVGSPGLGRGGGRRRWDGNDARRLRLQDDLG